MIVLYLDFLLMARVLKILQTLRNHWKKSVFGVCVVSYGGHWLYGKHCDNLLRRAACQEAREYGHQGIPAHVQVKKATVILNPAACSGKATSLFEKNAAPILHLGGMEVTLVKTDYEGQAKKLMDLMEHTDLLIVAGGDGTLQEVITGLLRRADQASFSKTPIGFIPLGTHNSLSHVLHPHSDNRVKHITEAALSILKGETVPLDVLQIKGERDQPVFALTGLRWGAYRDVTANVSKYWYLGPLKTKAAHLFSTLKEWPQSHEATLTYQGPTPRPPEESTDTPVRPPLLTRIFSRLALYWAPPKEELPQEEEPEPWEKMDVSAVELSISTQNKNPDLRRTEDALVVCVEPDTLSKGEFISTGSTKMKDPSTCSQSGVQLLASRCQLSLPEEGAGFYSIDNEEYEALPVEVMLLPRKLQFFCSPASKKEMLKDPQ
uniref:Acylglycerol kinase, mitochondrial n=2 Tax=Lepisosteus oculatus TaxID=7918 RepID=W5NIP2_LEPOC